MIDHDLTEPELRAQRESRIRDLQSRYAEMFPVEGVYHNAHAVIVNGVFYASSATACAETGIPEEAIRRGANGKQKTYGRGLGIPFSAEWAESVEADVAKGGA